MIKWPLAFLSLFLWGCAAQGPLYGSKELQAVPEPDWRFHEARLSYPIWREKMAIYELCTEDFPPRSPQTLRWCLEALRPPIPPGHQG